MSNLNSVKEFLNKVAYGDVQAAYDKYVAANFIHHNQYFKGDRQSLLQAMLDAHKNFPNKSFEIKKSYEAGDTVITHSLVKKENADFVVVHIFRFENAKIVELWDVGQILDKKSPNENSVI